MTISETVAELNRNPFTGKTRHVPRPFADDPASVYYDSADLRRHQQQWDQAKSWDDDNAQLQKDRTDKIEADRTAQIEADRAKARADLEADLRRRYLLNPAATVNDWEAAKADLVAKALAEMASPVESEKARLLATGTYTL